MMKKNIIETGIIILMMGLYSFSVSANDVQSYALNEKEFTIHSGVQFGMREEDVISNEKAEGFNVELPEEDGERIYVRGTIAGLDDSGIAYQFVNDELVFAKYFLARTRTEMSYEAGNLDFSSISAGLEKKYGEPTYSSDSNTAFRLDEYKGIEDIVGISYAQNASKRMHKLGIFCNYEVIKWEQWLLKQDDKNYVLIDHYLESDETDKNTYYLHIIGYSYIDDNTVENAIIDKEDEMDNDL